MASSFWLATRSSSSESRVASGESLLARCCRLTTRYSLLALLLSTRYSLLARLATPFFCNERINARSIFPMASQRPSIGSTVLAGASSTRCDNRRCVSNSFSEPCATRRNWTNSPRPSRPCPSAIFAATDTAARRICEVNAVNFFFGECSASSVAGFRKIHGLPPHAQVSIGPDEAVLISDSNFHCFPLKVALTPNSRFAIRSSLPTPDSRLATRSSS